MKTIIIILLAIESLLILLYLFLKVKWRIQDWIDDNIFKDTKKMKTYTEQEVKDLILAALNEVDNLIVTSAQIDGYVELDYDHIEAFFVRNGMEPKPKTVYGKYEDHLKDFENHI